MAVEGLQTMTSSPTLPPYRLALLRPAVKQPATPQRGWSSKRFDPPTPPSPRMEGWRRWFISENPSPPCGRCLNMRLHPSFPRDPHAPPSPGVKPGKSCCKGGRITASLHPREKGISAFLFWGSPFFLLFCFMQDKAAARGLSCQEPQQINSIAQVLYLPASLPSSHLDPTLGAPRGGVLQEGKGGF